MNTFKKTSVGLAFFVFLLVTLFCVTSLADIEGLPPGTEEKINDILETMYPPETYSLTVIPDPPKADTITSITSEIRNDSSKTDDRTTDAWILYSSDGGDTWEEADMDKQGESFKWNTELPAFPSGTEVLYGVRAQDTSTNIYVETPCLVTSWPPDGDPCMFDLAVDDDPIDDDSSVIPDDFDILEVKGGVDEDNLYIEIKVQGSIVEGKLTPMFAHIYGIGVMNPNKGNPSDILTQGFLGVYAPLADTFGYKQCMIISKPADSVLIDSSRIECSAKDSRLWMKIQNIAIGNNPSKYIKMIAADGAFTAMNPMAGVYYDYTHVSSIGFYGRWFTVEE